MHRVCRRLLPKVVCACEGLRRKPWVTQNFQTASRLAEVEEVLGGTQNVTEGVSPFCSKELHPEAHEAILKKGSFPLAPE